MQVYSLVIVIVVIVVIIVVVDVDILYNLKKYNAVIAFNFHILVIISSLTNRTLLSSSIMNPRNPNIGNCLFCLERTLSALASAWSLS